MAEENTGKLHSLAKEIRLVVGSEQFDLHGYDGPQLTALVEAAFREPIEVAEMVRVSFVIGGGKKCRQNYSPSLPKDLTEALRAIGFSEDRSASAVLASQGTFKQQHDTGKDLKYMHVFPRVVITAADDEGPRGLAEMAAAGELPPVLKAALCPLDSFGSLMNTRAPSFYAKKRVHRGLKMVGERLDGIEARMVSREAISAEDTELYEMCQSVPEKIEQLTSDLEKAVGSGPLTRGEKAMLTEEWREKADGLRSDKEGCDPAKDKKKMDKLDKAVAALEKRIEALSTVSGPAKAQTNMATANEIKKIKAKIAELDKLEKSKQLLTPDELHRVAARDGLKERLEGLEGGPKQLWFHDEIAEMEAAAAPKKAAPAKPWPLAGGSSSSGGDGGWSDVKPKSNKNSTPVGRPTSHAKKATGANMFALLDN